MVLAGCSEGGASNAAKDEADGGEHTASGGAGTGGGTEPEPGAGTGGGPSAGSGGFSESSGGTGGGTDAGSGGVSADPFAELPSPGCGSEPPDPDAIGSPSDAYSIATTTTEGEIERTYYVELPEDYDKDTAYRVVYTGRGCGGDDGRSGIWHYNDEGPIIQIYLEAEPGFSGNNCFDDHGGDESIEFDYFEKVHEAVRQSLCIDERRVFASGSSSGSWLSNLLACKYAGDILRGTATHTGGLPDGDCNDQPFAGLWLHDLNDPSNNYQGTVDAIERAIEVNGCDTTFDAERDPYVVQGATGDQSDSCEMFRGCPDEYPIVLCTLNGTAHGDTQSGLMRPAFFQLLGGL